MATYKSIRYNIDYAGKAGSLMPLLTFTSDGSDATADFTSKIDSTYDEYLFIFNNIHPQSAADFQFQGNAAGGSGFNETITTAFFYAYVKESNGASPTLMYNTGKDLGNATTYATLSADQTNTDADGAVSGYLHLFNPASTTFVKHYLGRVSNPNGAGSTTYVCDCHSSGYFNTTSAIDEISFKFSTGEIQGGTIQMFGVI